MKHPLGWIVTITWISMCLLLIALYNYHEKSNALQQCGYLGHCCDKLSNIVDRPLIAQMALHSTILTRQEKLQYRNIQELRLIKDDLIKHRPFGIRFLHLWWLNIRNDHIILGICFRDYGTNFKFSSRVAIIMIRLLTTIAGMLYYFTFSVFNWIHWHGCFLFIYCTVSALFYGQAKESTVGDISLSLA